MLSRSSFFSLAALILTGWILLLWVGIQNPAHLSSEETHYVPAARKILISHEFVNSEHPPLAKIGIAGGIALLGDRPEGWRFFPVLCSVIFLFGVLRLARALQFSRVQTLLAGSIVALNGVSFVLGRLAMLEMPMLAGLVWGIALWLESHHEQNRVRARVLLFSAGAAFGFSSACKWAGTFGFLLTLMATAMLLLLRYWKARFAPIPHQPRHEDHEFYSRTLWRGLFTSEVSGALILGAFLAYFSSFIPLYRQRGGWWNLGEWLHLQIQMFELQLQVTQSHPYGTQWYQWWLPTRTIWFEYTKELTSQVRAILLLPNPVVTILGLGGSIAAIRLTLQERDFGAFWLLFFYVGLYGVFAVIPRRLSFYYYYAPAFTLWSLLGVWGLGQIPKSWQKPTQLVAIAAVILGFGAYYPLYAARLMDEQRIYGALIWLKSWI